MRITFVTRKFGNVERNSHCDVLHFTPVRVARIILDCNGVFAIKAYGTEYLLIADFYGKFPIIRKLINISSSTTVSLINSKESLTSMEFRKGSSPRTARNTALKSIWCILRDTGSITYQAHHCIISRMDSQIEQYRQLNYLRKAKEGGGDTLLAILCLRTIPIDQNLQSPCELLIGRQYKSNLPAVSSRSNTDRLNTSRDTQE